MSERDYNENPADKADAIAAIRLALEAAGSDASAVRCINVILEYTEDDAPIDLNPGAAMFLAVVGDLEGKFEVPA